MSTVPYTVSPRCEVADLCEGVFLAGVGGRKMLSQLIGHCQSLQVTRTPDLRPLVSSGLSCHSDADSSRW